MNEANVRGEVFGLLRRMFYWPFSQTDARPVMTAQVAEAMKFLERAVLAEKSLVLKRRFSAVWAAIKSSINLPPSGRADIICHNPYGPSIAVEVKVFSSPTKGKAHPHGVRFAFSQIADNQRMWLNNHNADSPIDEYTGEASPALTYLALGTVSGRAGKDRYLYMIPWGRWLQFEDTVRKFTGQESIPLFTYPRMRARAAYINSGAFAARLLDAYELTWYDGMWHCPPQHPLFEKMYIEHNGDSHERDLSLDKERWGK